MIDLSLHISKLLFSNNIIVIPKLGIFEVETQDAYNHPVSNEFIPKFKKIKFIKNYEAFDDFLSKSLLINEADKLIADYVQEVKHSLETNKSFEFVNVGTLKIHNSGAIIFEQNMDFNYEKSYFGLDTLISEPIEKEKTVVISNSKVLKNKSKAKLLWIWFSIAVVVILAVVVVIFKDDIFSSKPLQSVLDTKPLVISTAKDTNDDVVDNIVSNDTSTLINYDTIQTEVAAQQEEQKVEDQLKQQNDIQESKSIIHKKYYVIAGCFKSSEKAQEYLLEIQQNGYNNASIEGKTNGGLTRVCYAGFDRYSKAKIFMQEVSKKESKSLWIQKITH